MSITIIIIIGFMANGQCNALFSILFLPSFINKEAHEAQEQHNHSDAQFVAVLIHLLHQLFLWYYALKAVADSGEDDVPQACAQSSIENEL